MQNLVIKKQKKNCSKIKFPSIPTIDSYTKSRESSVEKKTIMSLKYNSNVEKKRNSQVSTDAYSSRLSNTLRSKLSNSLERS